MSIKLNNLYYILTWAAWQSVLVLIETPTKAEGVYVPFCYLFHASLAALVIGRTRLPIGCFGVNIYCVTNTHTHKNRGHVYTSGWSREERKKIYTGPPRVLHGKQHRTPAWYRLDLHEKEMLRTSYKEIPNFPRPPLQFVCSRCCLLYIYV